jgi:hypothetical protein
MFTGPEWLLILTVTISPHPVGKHKPAPTPTPHTVQYTESYQLFFTKEACLQAGFEAGRKIKKAHYKWSCRAVDQD